MHDSRKEPIIIGISGSSGSGKTTIASQMLKLFETLGNSVVILSQDNYYHDQAAIALEQRPETNYDIPDAFEHDLLIQHLQCLKRGESIEAPIYEFSQHTRNLTMTRSIAPADIIIIEGILLFHDDRVAQQFDYKIFVQTPNETCFARRLERDMAERGRSEESIRTAWREQVLPSITAFIRPSAENADIWINNGKQHAQSVKSTITVLATGIDQELKTGKKKRKIPPEIHLADAGMFQKARKKDFSQGSRIPGSAKCAR